MCDGPIYRHRIASNMSQTQLAEAIGESQSKVSDWEALRVRCWPKMVERMAAAFGCDATQLYSEYVQWASMEPDVSHKEKQAAMRKSLRHTSPIARLARVKGIESILALSRATGIPRHMLTNYAYNPSYKSVDLALAADIAEVLGVEPGELLGKICEWQCRFRGLSPEDSIAEVVLYEEDLAERGELFYDDIKSEDEENW